MIDKDKNNLLCVVLDPSGTDSYRHAGLAVSVHGSREGAHFNGAEVYNPAYRLVIVEDMTGFPLKPGHIVYARQVLATLTRDPEHLNGYKKRGQ